MPIVTAGNIPNVPNVYVVNQSPTAPIQGVPTNKIGFVGTAIGGAKNSPTTIGSMTEYTQVFGNPQITTYDMGTQVFCASSQSANNFVCVRVTDGTDTSAMASLLDDEMTPVVGAILTSIYTGSLYNTIIATISNGTGYTPSVPVYKLTVTLPGNVPETFDNIGGTGTIFWTNLVNAVNFGQSSLRGPSQLVVASLNTAITAVTINAQGIYASTPTLSTTGPGSGATFISTYHASTAAGQLAIVAGGSGYAASDTITIAGGTFATAAVITVDTVDGGGAILTAHISGQGNYSVLPGNPVSQSATSGGGTGATFTVHWSFLTVSVTSGGNGYDNSSVLSTTGGSPVSVATFSLIIGAQAGSGPALSTYTLSGGTNGNNGVTSTTLIGDDAATPRTGMYALRNTQASLAVLADATDPTEWTTQASYGASEATYMISNTAAGYQDNISGAVSLLQNAGVDNYQLSVLSGDYTQINDPFNNQIRFVSPSGFKAGILGLTPVSGASLNKQLSGVIATQKTAENRTYSTADLSSLKNGRLDIITKPNPGGNYFGCALGVNTSSNPLTNQDNYPRVVNFLSLSLNNSLGQFIGYPITSTLISNITGSINTFLSGLVTNQTISSFVFPAVDESQAAQGILTVTVSITIFPILQILVVNLQTNVGVTVQAQPPQLLAAA